MIKNVFTLSQIIKINLLLPLKIMKIFTNLRNFYGNTEMDDLIGSYINGFLDSNINMAHIYFNWLQDT